MKVSYNWLKDFVNFKLMPEDLAHKLTMSGFEVEAVEKTDDDVVFDIGITPNRPDCLSIRGIAREISAILELPFKDITVKIQGEKGEGPSVKISDSDLCYRYSSRIIYGVKHGNSPEWLVKRLESCGIRATSNIVDITNYVLLETGQPLHAFDLDRLSEQIIIVGKAENAKSFTTLDGEKRALSKNMLLIWDAKKPVAVAGVIGGMNTEVSESTVNILLESAYFKPSSVRRTSKALNLSTESSYRFERGVDIETVTFALNRAAQLIAGIAGGRITHLTDNYPVVFKTKKIPISFQKINSVIGIDIKEEFVLNVLNNLGLKFEREGDMLIVTPPSFRDDIQNDIDIVEEIARLYGYDNILSTLPVSQMSAPTEHKTQELVNKTKDSFVKSGFSEVINYSFLNPDLLDRINLASDDKRRKLIYIKNPLRKEESAVRTSLIPALLSNVSMNLNRGEKNIRFFEISKVFLSSSGKLPDEVLQIAAVYHKENAASIWEAEHTGFFDLKGVIENILSDLKIADLNFYHDRNNPEPYLHPGKSCSIFINDQKAGSIGTLHPETAETFGIRGDVSIAEIYDADIILDALPDKTTFKSLPKFPYVERDVALIVSNEVNVSTIRKEILDFKSDIIESVNLFDIYKGKSIPDNKKSLAFSIRYRSSERTLTDSEVDELHSKIRERLTINLKAELRS